ncbi:MAG TPA: phosphoribosylglycinamide formyltransferase [Acidimicrobiia bacterium]|jgi:phosphoribosylglycinamide formyltransferase-1|nr:phosphoribosylglycinamide formyltransferase [Acidimicrobiia bacterium]
MPIAVLVSGSGTNLEALLDAAADPGFGAAVAVVISDRPGVKAIDRAEDAGVPAVVVDWSEFADRESFTVAVCDTAERHGAVALVLAGFMRVLAPVAIHRFPHRILNIHPSLLPSFPGSRAVEDALAHGVKLTGVTIHFVDEQVDHGPIIAQRAVEVVEGDTPDTLHTRIQTEEHRLYPEVVSAFARQSLRLEGRRVVWERA